MIPRDIARWQGPARRFFEGLSQDLRGLQGPTLSCAVAGGLGATLGLYALVALSMEMKWALLLTAAALCPFLAMILGGVRRLLLAIILMDTLIVLDYNFFYRLEIAELYGMGGLNISLTTLCLPILYALWLADLLLGRARLPGHLLRSSLPLAAYLLAAVLSVAVARRMELSLFGVFLLLQTFLLYVYVVAHIRSREEVLFVATMLLAGLCLEGLIMAGTWVRGEGIRVAGFLSRIEGGRVSGTVGGATEAAAAILLLLAPAAGVLLSRAGWAYKGLAASAFALGGFGLVLTFSRGGWVGAAVSGAILCVAAWRRRWLRPWFFVALAVAVLTAGLAFHEQIEHRLFKDDKGSADVRIPLMRLAWGIIVDHPWLGVGVNNYADRMLRHALEDGWAWIAVVHNKYLLVWAETGILGLAAFLWFLLATLRRGWVCRNSGDRLLSLLAIGFTAGVAGQMVHMFVDIYASRPLVQGLWLVAGLLAAMRHLEDKDEAALQESPGRASA